VPISDGPDINPSALNREGNGAAALPLNELGRQDTDAVASAAAGAAGLMGGGPAGSIIAIVTGRRALRRNPSGHSAGLARAGLTMGYVGLAITLVMIVIAAIFMISVFSKMGDDSGFDDGFGFVNSPAVQIDGRDFPPTPGS
jgi:hypothetical protein